MKKPLDSSDWDQYWSRNDMVKMHGQKNNSYPDVVDILCELSQEGSNCIEIGCGTGTYAIELIRKGRKCLATDMTEEALILAKQKGKYLYNIDVPTMKVDLFDMPFKDNEFDLIFSDGVIEHLDIEKSLESMYTKLKPGGWMVTKVPTGNFLYRVAYYGLSFLERKHMYEQWFPQKQWVEFAQKAKLKNISITKCGSILKGIYKRLFKDRKYMKHIPDAGRIHYVFYGQK